MEKPGRWWGEQDAKKSADLVRGLTEQLARSQNYRRQQFLASARLYGNSSSLGMSGVGGYGSYAKRLAAREQISYNGVQSVVDAVMADTITGRARPYFLTSGGTWAERTRAKKANKFMDGLFYEAKAYEKGDLAVKMSLVFGDGMLHIKLGKAGIEIERTNPSEWWVDELEAIEGNARQMYHNKFVDRGQLLELFPDAEQYIADASGPSPSEFAYSSGVADIVKLTECWHLPSGKGATDGKHLICTDKGPLTKEVEEWPHDFFPVARLGYNSRLVGYWNQGLAEILQAKQMEVIRLSWLIQRAMNAMGGFKILNPVGSDVPDDAFTDDVESILHPLPGMLPSYLTPPAVSEQLYQWRRDLIREMFEEAGYSQNAASAQKPAGVTAGVALRTLNDMKSQRMATFVKNHERFYLQIADISVALLAEHPGSFKVRAPDGKRAEFVDWVDVKGDIKNLVLQCFPTNALRRDPAGRLQDVVEMIQAGIVNPWQGQKLLDFPDLEQTNVLLTSAEEYISFALDKIADEGQWVSPTRYDNLQLARDMGLAYYNWGRTLKMEQSHLALLRGWIDGVQALMQTPAGGIPQPAPGAPQASPTAPPQGQLVQNVGGPQGSPVGA